MDEARTTPDPASEDPTLRASELLCFERALSDLSARLVGAPADQIETQVQEGLKIIASLLGVERCTLTEFLSDPVESYARFSFAPEGLPFIRPMRTDQLFPWTTAQLRENKVVRLRYPDGFPPEAEVDRKNAALGGFRASLNVPVVVGGSVRFVLTAASLTKDVEWPEVLVPRIRLFGEIFANALDRKHREEELRRLKDAAEEESVALREVVRLHDEHPEIVGVSDALRYVLYKLEQVAQTDATVLLLGETGVGKELFAHAIHSASRRKSRPLLKVDCTTLAPSLIESELFGHERGAFTGALGTRKGRFELADGGSVFLDEIGELPPDTQAKLLRVLQEGTVERVGASRPIKVNVRIIAATNRDLDTDRKSGRFRQDLFYRLNTFPITIPPLRERRTDIPILAQHFADLFCSRLGRGPARIARASMQALVEYDWPGNVRELENVVERSVITSNGKTIRVAPLTAATPTGGLTGELRTLAEIDREHIFAVLTKTLWRIEGASGAAKILGLHPDTLRYRMKKLHIRRPKPSSR